MTSFSPKQTKVCSFSDLMILHFSISHFIQSVIFLLFSSYQLSRHLLYVKISSISTDFKIPYLLFSKQNTEALNVFSNETNTLKQFLFKRHRLKRPRLRFLNLYKMLRKISDFQVTNSSSAIFLKLNGTLDTEKFCNWS